MINWLDNSEDNVLLMHSNDFRDLNLLIASLLIALININDFSGPNDTAWWVNALYGYRLQWILNPSYLRYLNYSEEVIKGLVPIEKTVKLDKIIMCGNVDIIQKTSRGFPYF